jgi:hypothetical protein
MTTAMTRPPRLKRAKSRSFLAKQLAQTAERDQLSCARGDVLCFWALDF